MLITEPGVYDMSSEDYHADPCNPMSLSSTGAKTLANDCPAKFMSDRQSRENKRCFDIGKAGHLIVLEPEKFHEQIVIVEGVTKGGNPSVGYVSADSKEKRDEVYKNGKTPLLKHELEMLQSMREAIWSDPVASKAFIGGTPEKSMFWKDKESGVWCRCRPDWTPKHSKYLLDYKTAGDSNPAEFQRAAFNNGYHQQAAWYLDGFEAVTGERPNDFWFIVQSKRPPYLVSICRLAPIALEIGAALNRKARGDFAWCLERNEWPSYRPKIDKTARVFTISPPAWTVKDYEQRMEAGDLEPPALKNQKIEEFA